MKNENFSFQSINDFDEHINQSIPNYDVLIRHILDISSYFIKDQSTVYDIGCSTGKLLNTFTKKYADKDVNFIGVDNSENLINQSDHPELIFNEDLKHFKFKATSFVTSIFTLQFLSMIDRKLVLRNIFNALQPGGAVIVAEKIYYDDGFMQDLIQFTHYDYKKDHFDEKEIIDKQYDLRYIMRPLNNNENGLMFRTTGFSEFYTFWQSLNFKAWILLKK